MKIYGYKINNADIEEVIPSELAEITLVANSNELRMIAEFINKTADAMDIMGDTYDHEHLSDKNHYFNSSPHFVVSKPE